jgi:hypothetical protein
MARQSKNPTDARETICRRLMEGESLRSICADAMMPTRSVVFRWLSEDDDFAKKYAFARDVQADTVFDDIMDIADDGRNDWMERNGKDSRGWTENGEALRRSHLRIEARKWMAAKLKPKKYGEMNKVELTGPDGGPIKTQSHLDLSNLTPEERAFLRACMEKLKAPSR